MGMVKMMYLFLYEASIDKLLFSVLPQIEQGTYDIQVVGMCFFDDNARVLSQQEHIGRKITKIAKEKGIQLMVAEKKNLERTIECDGQLEKRRLTPAECIVVTVMDGEEVGCFPNFYAALGDDYAPDYVISF